MTTVGVEEQRNSNGRCYSGLCLQSDLKYRILYKGHVITVDKIFGVQTLIIGTVQDALL